MLEPSNLIYNAGTVVYLDISTNPGWTFDHWEGNVQDPNSASTTITMNDNESITAVFVSANEGEGEGEAEGEDGGGTGKTVSGGCRGGLHSNMMGDVIIMLLIIVMMAFGRNRLGVEKNR